METVREEEFDASTWEDPTYYVKDLDSGKSYHVEEMEQYYNLVNLDSVVAMNSSIDSEEATSTLLQAITNDAVDELLEVEQIEDTKKPVLDNAAFFLHASTLQGEKDKRLSVLSSATNIATEKRSCEHKAKELLQSSDTRIEHTQSISRESRPITCKFAGCKEDHSRISGYCKKHEIKAIEDEDSRAQAQYLLPRNCRAIFCGMKGYGFVKNKVDRVYTVYILDVECIPSKSKWSVYRRYQEFKNLHDSLKNVGIDVPPLPPKRLIGSFGRDFLNRRQKELEEWLKYLLNAGEEFKHNIHENEDLRMFLTSKLSEDCKDCAKHLSNRPAGLHDFEMIQVIGRGSFGMVVLVRHYKTGKRYAMKVLTKQSIVKRKQIEHTRTERRVLGYTVHPFIVGLHYAFQTPQRLYFVLDYCSGGELFYHLTRLKRLPEEMVCFYSAEIVLAIEHLHSLGVIYRDLKPENILLDEEGHIKLADFGLAKEGITEVTTGTNSLCGTPEYLPPEILERAGHGTAVDWWNLGMVMYEMLTGLPPWYTNDRQKLFHRLRSARLPIPAYMSLEAESLIKGLLNRDPALRLGSSSSSSSSSSTSCSNHSIYGNAKSGYGMGNVGSSGDTSKYNLGRRKDVDPAQEGREEGRNGVQDIKQHPFFKGVDWDLLFQRKIEPPLRPHAASSLDIPVNFAPEFTRLPLPREEEIEEELQEESQEEEEEEETGTKDGDATRLKGKTKSAKATKKTTTKKAASELLLEKETFSGFTYESPSFLEEMAKAGTFSS